jgi:hypothetical protein
MKGFFQKKIIPNKMFLSENHLLVKEINYYNFQLIFGRKKERRR